MADLLQGTAKSMEDRGIAVAQLCTVSLAKIHAKDPTELAALERAASTTGFFYLNLKEGIVGDRVLAHLHDVYAIAEKYFMQPNEAKLNDIRQDLKPSQDLGWKNGHGVESFEVCNIEQ